MKLFNFHTHNSAEEFGIINAKANDKLDSEKQYSIGIHPWEYSKVWADNFILIKEIANSHNIVAIGETGLDPKSELPLSEQLEILSKHIKLSEEMEKPLIIHCVKYFNELIQSKNQHKPKQAWVIHGYRSKITIAQNLLNRGFLFSVNSSLLLDKQKAKKLIELIGKDNLFLETDDNDDDIGIIYNFATETFNVSINELHKNISLNLSKIGL